MLNSYNVICFDTHFVRYGACHSLGTALGTASEEGSLPCKEMQNLPFSPALASACTLGESDPSEDQDWETTKGTVTDGR